MDDLELIDHLEELQGINENLIIMQDLINMSIGSVFICIGCVVAFAFLIYLKSRF